MRDVTLIPFPSGTEVRWNFPEIGQWLLTACRTLKTCHKRHQWRMHFAAVDGRILKDVGISQADRFIEVNKSFWET